ncbi:hypothetical protein GH733_009212, partial [Mirounga leonina]
MLDPAAFAGRCLLCLPFAALKQRKCHLCAGYGGLLNGTDNLFTNFSEESRIRISRNKETLGNEAVSSNVIDYGHASKYGYTEDPLEVRIYDPEIPTDEVKNEFRSQQSISASVPTPNVICNSMFPVEDVFRQMDFPNRKKALEDVVQRSGIGSEFSKQKHLEIVDKGHSPAQKPKIGSGSKPSVKSTNPTKGDGNLGGHSARYKAKNIEDDTLPECKPVSEKAVSIQRKNKEMKKKTADSKKASAATLKKDIDASKAVETVTSASATKSGGKRSLEVKKAGIVKNRDTSKPVVVPENSEIKTSMEVKATENSAKETISVAAVEATEKEPVNKETEEMCVVLISNLPNKGYSIEEVYNLVKPFGALKDILILSSHKKIFMEINRKSADSMVKFYTCFPISMDGNQLSISMVPENMNIKDEEAIFTTLIKENDPEAQADKDPELGKESPDLKNSPVDESEVQTAADSLSLKPSEVEEETVPKVETETSVQQEEPYEEEPEKALCDSDFAIETLEVETQGEEVKVEIPLVASTPISIELFTENVEECVLNQQVYTSDFEKEEAEIINPETELSTSDTPFIEERNIKGILEESPSEAEDFFSGITQSMIEAVAEVDKHETVSEIVPSTCVVALIPGISTGDEKAVSKKGISGKSNMDEKEENEFNSKETRMDLHIGTEKAEKNDARMVAEKLEKIMAAMKEKPAENAVAKAYPSKGMGQANKPDETGKTSMLAVSNTSSTKSSIKAGMVSSPKAKVTASKSENQKSFLKSVLRDQINAEKKLSAKESGLLKPTSARSGLAESNKLKPTQSGVTRGGSGRISALQGKDSELDYNFITKQSQETEARPSVMKRHDSNNKALAGQNTKNPKSTTGRSSKSKEEPLFPFNLDEFVTVDEVIEEVNPFQTKQNPLKGKRKEALKNASSSELNLKKKKGKTPAPRVVEGELSFVTLDEIGEEEDGAVHLAQALVTVDEVIDEEEINMEEMVKNSNSLLTLDELIDQDDCISHSEPKDVTVLSVAEEQDLKQERLVTVDEIGEVEELPLNESADLSFATLNTKGDEGNTGRDPIGFISSQMPEDPSTLVTVDEIQDDSSDLHLVTLDEVTEEDEDSLADFNNLKEELNFVTVDEVGEEEDGDSDLKVELAQSKNDRPTDKRGDRKKKAVDTRKMKLEAFSQVGSISENVMEEDLKTMIQRHLAAKTPTKRVRIGKTPPSEKAVATDPMKGEEAFQISEVDDESGLKDSEPERKRKKIEDSSLGKSVVPDVPEDLDFLVPKAGFFCPICSLFYSGEKAMTNHCKSTRHKQNTEKFMAKQRKEKEQNEAEERSFSRVEQLEPSEPILTYQERLLGGQEGHLEFSDLLATDALRQPLVLSCPSQGSRDFREVAKVQQQLSFIEIKHYELDMVATGPLAQSCFFQAKYVKNLKIPSSADSIKRKLLQHIMAKLGLWTKQLPVLAGGVCSTSMGCWGRGWFADDCTPIQVALFRRLEISFLYAFVLKVTGAAFTAEKKGDRVFKAARRGRSLRFLSSGLLGKARSVRPPPTWSSEQPADSC